jgi:hypothetical protein
MAAFRAQGSDPRVGCQPGARADQPRRRGRLGRRFLACIPPACGNSPRSRYSRPMMGRSAPTVAAETPAGWLPARNAGPVVVVVASPVVVGAVVVGAMLVVATSVVVDATVLVGTVVVGRVVVVDALVLGPAVVGGAVVVGPAVVGGAVTVGWVVAPTVEGAVVGVVLPTAAGAWDVVGPVVVVGLLPARRPGFPVVEGRGAVVVVDADVGADCVGNVGCATPGTRRGGSGWGSRVAEATMAASTAVVSPKTNNSSLQGRRGVARWRGGGVGMAHRPGLTCCFRLKGVRGSRTLTGHKGRGSAHRIERYVPVSSRSFCRLSRR